MSAEVQDKSIATDQQRPFLGLRSFDEENKGQFGGRDKEIEELFELIEENGLTVVFGKSGIGKTSLLRAGLMPKLRSEFFFPIYIRIDYNTDNPLSDLKAQIYSTLSAKDPDVEKINGRSLWEYFHDMNFSQGLVKPVLIIDQFEEIFTLGENNPGVKKLLNELADLAMNRIPVAVQNRYKKLGETVPTRYSTQSYRVTFSLREDFLPRLEEIKQSIPDIMDNRFRVVQMTISQALEAAIKPGKGLIDEDVARDIIGKLPGISETDFQVESNKGSRRENYKVEPFLLSFICDRMNEVRIEQGKKTFTKKLVKDFEVEDAIRSFYNETLAKYPITVEHGIEDLLLTQGGFRKLQALGELQNKYQISDKVLDELIEARILRKESRDNIDYVELIHDVLTGVIKEKRDKRIQEEEERERLETLRLERAKNRRRLIRIGSVLGIFIIAIIGYSTWQTSRVLQNIEQKQRKSDAREILLSALSLSIYEGQNEGNSALLSKYAYELYDQDREAMQGINENDRIFYNGLLMSSFSIGRSFPNWKFRRMMTDTIGESNDLRASALVKVNHEDIDGYLIALRDRTVREITIDNSSLNIQNSNYSDLNQRIKAIDYNNNAKKLAIAQNRVIYLYGEEIRTLEDSIVIPEDPDFRGNIELTSSYFMNFMPDGSIAVTIGKRLYKWNYPYWEKPANWNEHEISYWFVNEANGKIVREKDNEEIYKDPNAKDVEKPANQKLALPKADRLGGTANSARPVSVLSKGSSGKLNIDNQGTSMFFSEDISAMAVSSDSKIAISNGVKISVIDDDEIKVIKFFSKWKKVTSLSFDPSGRYLVLGNKKGGVFIIDLKFETNDSEIEDMKPLLAHKREILDISFKPINTAKKPIDSTMVFASSSSDGTVAIWKNEYTNDESLWWKKRDPDKDQGVWNALILDPSIFSLFKVSARKISFSQKGGNVLVAYDDGTIIRWPTFFEKLNQLVCNEHNGKDLTQVLRTVNKIPIEYKFNWNDCLDDIEPTESTAMTNK